MQRLPPPTRPKLTGMWAGFFRNDTEQYAASNVQAIRADPVLRLHLRSKLAECGGGMRDRDGVVVKVDDQERTVMREKNVATGETAGTTQTTQALWAALDLHAHHHFTHAAAVDGSVKEYEMPGHRHKRRVAFRVYEGMYSADDPDTLQQGVWGGRLASDLEIADAETAAIHEYLWRVVNSAGSNVSTARVLIQSDCLGALDARDKLRVGAVALPAGEAARSKY